MGFKNYQFFTTIELFDTSEIRRSYIFMYLKENTPTEI